LVSTQVADVDGDDALEVVWGAYTSGRVAWSEIADMAAVNDVSAAADEDVEDVAVADVDGDADYDVVVAHDAAVKWYENTNGAGSFAARDVDANAARAGDPWPPFPTRERRPSLRRRTSRRPRSRT